LAGAIVNWNDFMSKEALWFKTEWGDFMRFLQSFKESALAMSLCGFILAVVCFTPTSQAETKSMITATAASTRMVKMSGAVHPLVKTSIATGGLASNKMLDLHIALNRPEESNKALDQLIQAQVNPNSSQYHHWLTPAQIGAQYGANNSDIQQISNWLKANHLTVTSVNASHNMINVRGSVQDIQTAFQTSIKTFSVEGQTRYANVVAPSIPAAFTNAISLVGGLHNIPQRNYAHKHAQKHLVTPNFVDEGDFLLSIADLTTQYNIAPLYKNSVTGAGVSVAVLGLGTIDLSVVSQYWQASGVSVKDRVQQINTPTFNPYYTNDRERVEAYLDVELISSLAYGSTVKLVVANSIEDALSYTVENNLANIISITYGDSEFTLGLENTVVNSLLQQASAQGTTVIVSTGDSLSTAGDNVNAFFASHGLQVNGFATTPYGVAVGGTQWDDRLTLPSTSPSSGAQSGISRYIGEIVWNYSCASGLYDQSSLAAVIVNCNDPNKQSSPVGSGGGVSSCAVYSVNYLNISCGAGYPIPSWQSGVVGIQKWPARTIPDVSMLSRGFIVCDDPTTACQIVVGGEYGSYDVFDGTSVATPMFAAVVALAEQTQISSVNPQGRMGLLNPLLYSIAGYQYGASAATAKPLLSGCDASHADRVSADCVFYDVTAGSNASPCAVGWGTLPYANPAGSCTASGGAAIGITSLADGTPAYLATPGYDLTTGLGTVNVTNFVNAVMALNVVQNVTATASGSSVTLSWTADPNATSYNIYQGTTAGGESATPVMSNLQGNSAQISGLVSGQRYYFRVAAVTKYGLTAQSNEASVILPPSAPTGLSSSAGNSSITLTWTASPSATSYSVYQGSTSGGESATPIATGLTNTSYTVNSLSPGATLYFTVVAYNNSGASPSSAEQPQTVLPGTPGVLIATAGNGSVQLDWSAGAGDVLYNVYMGNSAGGEAATPYLKSFAGTSVVISNLYNNNTYYFTVKAVNSGGESAATSEVSATPVGSKSGGGGDIGALGLVLLMGLGLMKYRHSKH
jgi:subtilase family serine protease